jgi:hypothetical protein
MDCWICKRTALGVCRFCGRGICEEHARFHPYILDLYTAHSKDVVRALVVEDALHCGVCKPRPEPIDVPELE